MDLRRLLHDLGIKPRRLTQRKQLRVIATAQGLRGEYEILIGKLAQVDFPCCAFAWLAGKAMTICSSSNNRASRVPAGSGSLRMKPISASPASKALACDADGISRMVNCTFG